MVYSDGTRFDGDWQGGKCHGEGVQTFPSGCVFKGTFKDDEKEGKVLKVKFIQKEGKANFDPAYLFDEGSTIEWTPCGKKLTCSYPGIKFAYGPDEFLGNDVTVLEMDGKFDNLQE